MKKMFCILSICLATMQPALAEGIRYDGCDYQGAVQHGKPHGQGVLTCPDGRIYTGGFAHGLFHGKGQYIVPNRHGLVIVPFGLSSGKLKGMVLVGTFKQGVAHGVFKVYQDGQHAFNFTFNQGVAMKMSVAK